MMRNYNFDLSKIGVSRSKVRIEVSSGQFDYETRHLLAKLSTRDPKLYSLHRAIGGLEAHPIFDVVAGEIADWEIT